MCCPEVCRPHSLYIILPSHRLTRISAGHNSIPPPPVSPPYDKQTLLTMASNQLKCTMYASTECRNAHDTIYVSDDQRNMKISFQRTIRVADGTDISELPPTMGMFVRLFTYTFLAVSSPTKQVQSFPLQLKFCDGKY